MWILPKTPKRGFVSPRKKNPFYRGIKWRVITRPVFLYSIEEISRGVFWYSTSGTFRPCLMLLDCSYYTWRGSHESGSCFQTSTSSVLVLRHLWDTIWHHHDTHPPTSTMLYGKQSSHWWQFKRWNFLFSILFMFERTIQIYTLMK